MKFTLVALSSVLALVAAQESSSTTSGAPATTTSMTAAESCVLRCNDDDRCCKAQCLGVPCPSDEMANDTNDCVANCDQGDGSEADTQAYAQCQARCYTTHYFPATVTVSNGASSTGTDSTATSTGDSSDSNSDDSNSNSSNSDDSDSSDSDSPSGTSSSEDPEETGAAAVAQIKLGASAAGLAGFLLVAWAL